eukprot:TRINITY_DN19135_c0_g1_i1.p1 TRINITY_DN19135_c0_g1~~TRINITY_DN19135_c0_g1_i1.p1  ORF type:complete len:401 (+),score=74.03 TRINITY_DN19135_c0_g1_i1:68-1270(+)
MRRNLIKTDPPTAGSSSTQPTTKASRAERGSTDGEWSFMIILICFLICYLGVVTDMYLDESQEVDTTDHLVVFNTLFNSTVLKARGAPLGYMHVTERSMRKGDLIANINLLGDFSINFVTASTRPSVAIFAKSALSSPLLDSASKQFKRDLVVIIELLVVISPIHSHHDIHLSAAAMLQTTDKVSLLKYVGVKSSIPTCLNQYSRRRLDELRSLCHFIYAVVSEVMEGVTVQLVMRAVDLFLSRRLPGFLCSDDMQPCLVIGVDILVPPVGGVGTVTGRVEGNSLILEAKHILPKATLLAVVPPVDFISDFDFRGVVPHNVVKVLPVPGPGLNEQHAVTELPLNGLQAGWLLLNTTNITDNGDGLSVAIPNSFKASFECADGSDQTVALNSLVRTILNTI